MSTTWYIFAYEQAAYPYHAYCNGRKIDEINPRLVPQGASANYESQAPYAAMDLGLADGVEFRHLNAPRKGKDFDERHLYELADIVMRSRGNKVIVTMDTQHLAENSLGLAEQLEGLWIKHPEITRKAVIVTGADQPLYKDPQSDGHTNLKEALSQNDMPTGVYVIMHGKLFNAGERYDDAPEANPNWLKLIIHRINRRPPLDTSRLDRLTEHSQRLQSAPKAGQSR